MIRTLIGFALIITLNILMFVCFPYTNQYGHYFLYGLTAFWCVLYLYLKIKAILFRLFPFSLIFKISFFIFMLFINSMIIPQSNGKPIIKKILNKEYPTSNDIKHGRIKFLNSFLMK